jgi:hypothetical protein
MFGSTSSFLSNKSILYSLVALLLGLSATPGVRAQAYERDLNISSKALLTIKNRTGRVSVIASDSEKTKPTLKATSTGAPVVPGDIVVSGNEVVVREHPYRIDLIVSLPRRSRVRVESEAGMVDVIGDFEVADVITNTGTIHADVPVDALKFKFQWESSRPRYLSDVELPRVKEGHAGTFSIAGVVGPDAKRKKHKKPQSSEDRDAEADKATTDGNGDKATETSENNSEATRETGVGSVELYYPARRDSAERRSQHGAQ